MVAGGAPEETLGADQCWCQTQAGAERVGGPEQDGEPTGASGGSRHWAAYTCLQGGPEPSPTAAVSVCTPRPRCHKRSPSPNRGPRRPVPTSSLQPCAKWHHPLGSFPRKICAHGDRPPPQEPGKPARGPSSEPCRVPWTPGPCPEPQTRIHLHGLCACRTGLNPPLLVPTSPGSPVSPWLPEGACERGRSLFYPRPSKAPRSSPVPRTPCDLPCHLPDLAISSHFPHPMQGPHSSSSTRDVVLSQGLCTSFTQEPVRSSPAPPKCHDLAHHHLYTYEHPRSPPRSPQHPSLRSPLLATPRGRLFPSPFPAHCLQKHQARSGC